MDKQLRAIVLLELAKMIEDANGAMGILVGPAMADAIRSVVADAAAPSASAQQAEPVEELAMMVRLLVHALRKAAPANPMSARAVDYLERHGLQGSVLRDAPAPSASPAALTEDQIAVRAGIPFVGLSVTLMKALRRLSFAAQTSGGVAGRDDELMGAIKQAQEALEAAKGKGLEEVAVDPASASSEAASPADQEEDARDAARYRWIAQNAGYEEGIDCHELSCFFWTDHVSLGAAIDAAMSATPPAAEGK